MLVPFNDSWRPEPVRPLICPLIEEIPDIPVPDIGTVVGPPTPFDAMTTEADLAPALGGENATVIVHEPPPGSGAVQKLLKENDGMLAPASETPLIVSGAVPVFVT